jgi:L,D-peptidoglycan transpeptidase YkuD (ErfK/YbiS/YcfS/YnhG family)
MKRLAWPLTGLLAAALALAGCTSTKHTSDAVAISPVASPSHAAASSAPSVDPASAPASSVGAPSPAAPATAQPPTHAATPTATPTPTPTPQSTPKPPPPAPAPKPKPTTPAPQPKPPAPLLVQQLADVGNARQVVIVTSSSWTTDVATLQTFEKDTAGWHAVFPAMPAHIGRAGFSADKHEGDLKTPAGKYGFGTMFGQRANPGVKFPYRQADSQSVWVDDVNSPYYNTWQENAALSGEHLASSGYSTAYAYAAAIAYNVNPIVKGKGSAIFLHVSTGGGTAGCVSVAQSSLLQVLRWLDPAKAPVIVMGPTSVIRQY